MSRIVSRFAFAFFALLLVVPQSSAQTRWQETTASDGSFSFAVPATPKEERRSGVHYDLPSESLIFIAKTPRLAFIFAGRTKYHENAAVPARGELQANADNFAKSVDGKLTTQRFFTWSGSGGDSLEAHESIIAGDRGTFRQLYVIDGKTVYGVIAGPLNPDNEADIDRFFGTLKINKKR